MGQKKTKLGNSTPYRPRSVNWILQAGCLLDPQVSPFQTTAGEHLSDCYDYLELSASERLNLLFRLGMIGQDGTPDEVPRVEAAPVDLGFKPPADFVREHLDIAADLGLRLGRGDIPGEPFKRAITKRSAAELTAGFQQSGFPIKVVENVFTRDEHLVISAWLRLKQRGLPTEARRVIKSSLHFDADWAAARINIPNWTCDRGIRCAVAVTILRGVWKRLPQWAAWSPSTGVLLARQKPKSIGQEMRKVALLPRRVLTINWADSGPGYSWPNEYNLTWLPLYNRYILTVSADSPEGLGGYTDLAIASYGPGNDLIKSVKQTLIGDWQEAMYEWDQTRWEYVLQEGIISAQEAMILADEVWGAGQDA
jgi:hypothetical protein